MLTQDKAWLESVWPQLEKAVHYIQVLRQRSLKNDDPLDDGLMPPGDIDGGLDRGDRAEYSNVYWNLLGLKAAIDAARWLGKADEADAVAGRVRRLSGRVPPGGRARPAQGSARQSRICPR